MHYYSINLNFWPQKNPWIVQAPFPLLRLEACWTMCSILQKRCLWQGSNKKVHKQLEELNFLFSFCFVVLNVVIFNMATLTSSRNEKVICFLWLLSGCSPWEQICRKFSLFSLLLSPEICCLLSPYWLQRIVVFYLLSAPENSCVLSPIGSRESLCFSPIGSREFLSPLSNWL